MRAQGQRTTPAGEVLPMGPPCQCRAASLIFRLGEIRGAEQSQLQTQRRVPADWHTVPPDLLSRTIRDCLPEGQRE
eukprot:9493599-Lingulodinium_polyedra.AAC.1